MILRAPSRDVMNKLARGVLSLYSYDRDAEDQSLEAELFKAIRLIARTPTIVANDASTMDLSFAALPADGDYTLVVKARSGASTDYAPAVARRNVTVRAAS